MTTYGPPEHVYVENDWYDGPRAGVANVNGLPHRFISQWDEKEDEYMGTFLVWPIDPEELALEQEQWRIFASWNEQYEAGLVGTDSHPGHPGTNTRWDEIDLQLSARRKSVPSNAKQARAQMIHLEREQRYAPIGPAYQLSWRLL
ncbi:MAG: hypothetical protein KDI51_06915 [Xanthomonadales bacterium]|nr:hypothetical protein [Xanthomonadales bacterium]